VEQRNIGGRRPEGQPEDLLSNFPALGFVIDGVELASTEGFIQGIKFPEGDPRREQAFRMSGGKAKRMARGAEGRFVWWQGTEIAYGSFEHHALIERAIRAKFDQQPTAMQMLLATEGMELIHDLGTPESATTSMPARVFCAILTRIREERLARS